MQKGCLLLLLTTTVLIHLLKHSTVEARCKPETDKCFPSADPRRPCLATCRGPALDDIWVVKTAPTFFILDWEPATFCYFERHEVPSYNVTVKNKTATFSYVKVKKMRLQVSGLRPASDYVVSIRCNAELSASKNDAKTVRTKALPHPTLRPRPHPHTIIRTVLEYAVGVGMLVLLAASVVLYVAKIRENCALSFLGKKKRRRNASDVAMGSFNDSYEPAIDEKPEIPKRRKSTHDRPVSVPLPGTLDVPGSPTKKVDEYKYFLSSDSERRYTSPVVNLDRLNNNIVDSRHNGGEPFKSSHHAMRNKRRHSSQVLFNSKDRLPPIEDVPEPTEEEEEEEEEEEPHKQEEDEQKEERNITNSSIVSTEFDSVSDAGPTNKEEPHYVNICKIQIS